MLRALPAAWQLREGGEGGEEGGGGGGRKRRNEIGRNQSAAPACGFSLLDAGKCEGMWVSGEGSAGSVPSPAGLEAGQCG